MVITAHPDAASPLYPKTGRASAVARDIVLLSEPLGVRAEAVRALRAHVMAQHVRGRRRALAVCATRANTGCTFVAANLAVGLSQIGLNTLLVDGDLRAPSIQVLLPPPPNVGDLSLCLSSEDVAFGDCIAAEVLPDLSIMYAGVSATPPPELLAGDRFKSLMDFCLREFDVTIVAGRTDVETAAVGHGVAGIAEQISQGDTQLFIVHQHAGQRRRTYHADGDIGRQ